MIRAHREDALLSTLTRQLAGRQVDRRTFLRHAARLGISVAAAAQLVDRVIGRDAPRPAGAQTPKKGGTLKVATKADFTSFDPIIAVDYETWILVLNVFDVIVNYDKDGKLYPVIAKEIPKVSNGGKTFEIKVRDGAKFHNGRQIVADDIKYSLERVALKENKSWGIAYVGNVVGLKDYQERKLKELPGIKVVDRMTVVIDLETPSANYFNYLTMSTNAPVPREEVEKLGPEWGKKVVSTCLTEIRWASSTDIQVPSNVVLRKNHVPISIKSCRNSLRARQVAFSVFLATGSGLLRVDNWSTSGKQEIT